MRGCSGKSSDYNGFRGSSDPSPIGAAYLWHRQARSPVRPRRGGIFVAAVNMPPLRGSDVICGGLMLQICRAPYGALHAYPKSVIIREIFIFLLTLVGIHLIYNSW